MSAQDYIDQFNLSDDNVLDYTQSIRKQLVEQLLGQEYATDGKVQQSLLITLSDMDKVALTKKRLGANEKQTAADLLVAKTLAKLANKLSDGNPFEVKDAAGEESVPTLDVTRVPKANPVPGEMDVGLSDACYDDLMDKFD